MGVGGVGATKVFLIEPEPDRIVHGEPWIRQQPDRDPDKPNPDPEMPDLDPDKPDPDPDVAESRS